MIIKFSFFSICLWLLLIHKVHAGTELVINGITDELEQNVNAYLMSIPEEEYSTSLRFQTRLKKNTQESLKALGFYHSDITFSVLGEEEDDQTLIMNVDAGEPVVIYSSDIVIYGEAENDVDFIHAIDNSGLGLGKPLHHGKYSSLKSSLQNLALRKGYFQGKFTMNRLEVAPTRNQAMIHLHYDSGPRYHFGEITINDTQIEEKRVRSIIPFEKGEPYLASQIGDLNQSFSNTGWFSSISITPDLDATDDNYELPMDVMLQPAVRNQVETSVGYSTDVGPRASVRWIKPWLNEYGHSLDTMLSVSRVEPEVTIAYKIPLEQVLEDYYLIKYGLRYVDNHDTNSMESVIGLEKHKIYDSGWHRILYTKLVYEDFTQGIQDGTSWLVLPGISFYKSRSRGGAMPMWGDSKRLSLEGTSKALSSNVNMVRMQAQGTIIRSIGQNHRGVARAALGAMYVDDFYELGPSVRFFTGGANSIRGYAYEEVSPRDEEDYLTGGQFMLATSLEYQYRLVGKWWLATFVDYGDAWVDGPELKMGTGVGIRWASPVGPVRFDLAWGLDAEPGDEFQIHFVLGPEV